MYDYTTLKMGEYVLTFTEDNKIAPAISLIGEINEKIHSLVSEPKELIHYCSYSSFENIIKTNTFWMSDLNNMNDKKEGKWFIELIKRVIKKDFSNNHISNLITLLALLHCNLLNSYASCFTTLNDNFEKWEIYGDKGYGIAVVINPQQLSITRGLPIRSSFATSEEICSLLEINYNLKEQEEIIKKCIEMFLNKPQQVHNIATFLSKLAYTCKRENFRTENEWRILLTPLDFCPNYSICNTSDFTINPRFTYNQKRYYSFNIPANFISEIIIGPKSCIPKNKIKLMLEQNNYNINSIKIYKSSI